MELTQDRVQRRSLVLAVSEPQPSSVVVILKDYVSTSKALIIVVYML